MMLPDLLLPGSLIAKPAHFDEAKIERASCAIYLLFILREKAKFLNP
jgi:hypothetical protein